MKRVYRIETFDGVLHDNEKSATRHIDNIYGVKISKLASRLLRDGNCKYATTQDFIDANLDAFVELANIKEDLYLDSDDDI